jgi:hypothetical protein
MTEPHILKADRPDYWWESAEDGFYIFASGSYDEHKMIVIRDHDLELEVIRYCDMMYCYLDGGAREINLEQAMEYLFDKYPEYAEWALFHPEFI